MELVEKQIGKDKTPKGFKQTEVGLIPEDWGLEYHNDLATTIDSLHKTPAFSDSGFPMVRVTDIKLGYLNLRNTKLVSKEVFNEFTRNYLPQKGDIVMSRVGSYGVVSFVNNDERFCLGQNTVVIKSKINAKYLYYILSSQLVINQIELESYGSGYKSLSLKNIKELKIPLPPTHNEQKAIAGALSNVDALISSLDQLITKKKGIKQGTMQELLMPPHTCAEQSRSKGGKRLPGFDGKWERIKVDNVITVARGGSPRPIQDYLTTSSNGINWIKIGDTSSKSKYITSSNEKILPEGIQNSREVHIGDFLLSNSMSFGRPYILKINGCIHDGWLVLQNYQEFFDREFLYYTLMSKDVYNQYLMKASGSSVLNLNKEIVKTVELNRPKDIEEQRAIAKILSDMDLEIEQLEVKKAKYKQIKQGMMQELLTGKTRLV